MPRIRAYFAIIALRHVVIGALILNGQHELEDADAVAAMVSLFPLEVWAGAMILVGLLCSVGILWPRELPGRFVVVLSIALTTAVATALLLSFAEEPESTGILAVLFLVLVAKDFLVVGLRWTNPFAGVDVDRLEKSLDARIA